MRSAVFFSLAIIFFMTSCGSTSNSSSGTYIDPHTKMHRKMHNELYQEEIEKEFNTKIRSLIGNYSGTLPCADCEGIYIELELFQDMTYSSKMLYKGRMETAQADSGTFTLSEQGIIALERSVANFSYFQKDGSNLRVLDKNGKKIISSLTERYMLRPSSKVVINNYKSDNPKAEFYTKKWDMGIAFYAIGNDSKWTLDIRKSSNMIFIDPSGVSFEFPTVEPLASIDSNTLGYRSMTDENEIIIQLVEQECTNGASDERLAYKVHLKFKQKRDKEFKEFAGCGNIVPDHSLNGNWTIVKVNDKYINPDSFPDKTPQITIDLFHEKFWGNDGCNNFNGTVKYKMGQLIFGPAASTLMACPNDEVSIEIMKSISEKNLTYDLSNELIFYHGKSQAITLRRIE